MTDENVSSQTPRTDNGYRNIATFLSETRVLLENSHTNPVIHAKMISAGYPATEIEARLADLQQLFQLHQQQLQEYGEQIQATETWEARRKSYHPVYTDHVALARIAFRKNPAAQRALGLGGSRAESQAGYILQGATFYENALNSPDIVSGLASKGIDLAALEGGKAAFEHLQSLKAAQQREMGEAQQATKLRDDAWDTLAEWAMDFRATAKVVLRQEAQLMEQLGIMQR